MLNEPDAAIEYDTASFSKKQTVKIPAEACKIPRSFAINGKGQMLFVPERFGGEQVADRAMGDMTVWLWDGQAGKSLARGAIHKITPGRTEATVLESIPQWALAADGEQIFWFTNIFRKLERRPDGGEISVVTSSTVFQTNLIGAKPVSIAEFVFPPCKCDTGACSETCPEADFWWPQDGVKDFFITTHWIQGQVSTTYQASYLYRRSSGKWLGSKLPVAMEQVLDAAESGAVIVHAISDGGCCGWGNEGNDQTMITRGGKSTLLFDERKRYENPNYDVSFFTSDAILSPNLDFVALTITSNLQPGMEIRLSDDGKTNTAELGRIRRALGESPAVEILKLEDPPKRIIFIPHATAAGWLTSREILIVEEHFLVALDITTGARRKSRIQVPDASHVFLR